MPSPAPETTPGTGTGTGTRTKLLDPKMAVLLRVAAVLVFLAGVQLFVLTEHTDRYFAWTVRPSVTAAFLGAAYWASVALEWMAARARTWADARIAVPSVLVFTTLTLVATLLHLDLFHLDSDLELGTRLVTWIWIAIYAVVPVLMAVALVFQRRLPGGDPPRSAPLARWVRVVVALQAVVLVPVGVALFIAPTWVSSAVWPWSLTALTGRAVGAWLISLGLAAAQAVWERDARRVLPAAVAGAVLVVLQIIVLVRYAGQVSWSEPSTYGFLAVLVSMAVTGIATVMQVLEPAQPPAVTPRDASAPGRPAPTFDARHAPRGRGGALGSS